MNPSCRNVNETEVKLLRKERLGHSLFHGGSNRRSMKDSQRHLHRRKQRLRKFRPFQISVRRRNEEMGREK